MESNRKAVLVVALIGVVATLVAWNLGLKQGAGQGDGAMKTPDTAMEPMDHSAMTMEEMVKGLEGKTGEAFDIAFVEMMIVHHQGAVDMAKLVASNAKHEELKRLGQDILTTQSQEIGMMQGWLKKWKEESPASESAMEGMAH